MFLFSPIFLNVTDKCLDSLRRCYDSVKYMANIMNATTTPASQNAGLTPTNWLVIGSISASIIGALILLIFRSGKVVGNIENVNIDLKDIRDKVGKIPTLQSDVSSVQGQISTMKDKVDTLWIQRLSVSRSPMQLNSVGDKILNDSGIKQIIDDRFKIIVESVGEMKPTNAFEVQEYTREVVERYRDDQSLKDMLETGAFKAGSDVITVLFVGALYIRDRVLEALKFNVDDIDKYQPKDTKL